MASVCHKEESGISLAWQKGEGKHSRGIGSKIPLSTRDLTDEASMTYHRGLYKSNQTFYSWVSERASLSRLGADC